MKKLLIFSAIVLLGSIHFALAQDELEPSKRERLEALKVAYLTEKLSLTPEEAQQFWPVYNEFEEKKGELRKQKRDNESKTKLSFFEMSDDGLSEAIDKQLELEQQELNLMKEYTERFKKILPMMKVAKLQTAEHGFRRELLHRAKDRTKIPGGPPH